MEQLRQCKVGLGKRLKIERVELTPGVSGNNVATLPSLDESNQCFQILIIIYRHFIILGRKIRCAIKSRFGTNKSGSSIIPAEYKNKG